MTKQLLLSLWVAAVVLCAGCATIAGEKIPSQAGKKKLDSQWPMLDARTIWANSDQVIGY